ASGGDASDLGQVLSWFQANPDPLVVRDMETGGVVSLLRIPTNSGERISRTVDGTVTYRYPTTNYGFFNLRLNATYIDSYKLIPTGSITGEPEEFVGKRNQGVSGAATLPRWRANMRLGWTYGNHLVNLTGNYVHHYSFDGDDIIEDAFNVGTVVP